MRRKDTKFEPHEKGIIAVSLTMAAFIAVMLFTPQVVMGATVNTLETVGAPWADSAFTVIRDQSDSTLIDSTKFDETFPYDTLYTWDDTKNYTIKKGMYFPGDGWATWNEEKLFTVSAAGTGPFTLQYYLFDTAGGGHIPINDVLVTARNVALTANVVQARSDVNGLATLISTSANLASLALSNPLYVFPTAWDTEE